MRHVPFKDAGTIKVNFQKATLMKPRQLIPNHVIKVMCQAHWQMNAIRAKDGVPIGSSVTQEYWDDIINRLNEIVLDATGRTAHCHQSLYGS